MTTLLARAGHARQAPVAAVLLALGFVLASPASALAAGPIDLFAPTASATATPNPVSPGGTVTFDGSQSDDPDTTEHDGNLLYQWSYGDGTPASGSLNSNFTITHTYTKTGVYTAVLTVTDTSGKTGTDSLDIQVGKPPLPRITATPSNSKVAQNVHFDASGTVDQDDATETLDFVYDFGDGSGSLAGKNGVAADHVYNTAGTYTAKVTVTDPGGAYYYATTQVTVTNNAPTANGTINPGSPRVSQTVAFDASSSTDGETPGAITYKWDFGDKTPVARTRTTTHIYDATGPVLATLTVTDPQGLTNTKNFPITVQDNTAPTVHVQADRANANVGQVVGFTSDGTTDSETPTQMAYAWNFNDGGTSTDSTETHVTHAFSSPGTQTVSLTVTDAKGASTTSSVSVDVGNLSPTAVAVGPASGAVGQVLHFDGSGSSDPETPDNLMYRWRWVNDNDLEITDWSPYPTANYSYKQSGTFTVTLQVKDPLGAIGEDTLSVAVSDNGLPTAVARASTLQVRPGKPVQFDGSDSHDGATTNGLSYLWDFGDGSTSTEISPSHSFAEGGIYGVTLRVTDGSNGQDTAVLTIKVVSTLACENATQLGTWNVVASKRAVGGSYCTATAPKKRDSATTRPSLGFQMTGDRLDLRYAKASGGGVANVLVDGTSVGKVDFSGSDTKPRKFTTVSFAGLGEGQHTISLVVLRKTVFLDGFEIYGRLGAPPGRTS